MKQEVPLNRVNRLLNSGQVILVTSASGEQKNVATIAWHMPVSHQPPLLGIAVASKHFTSELIRTQKEFIVNIPDVTLLDQIVACGSTSGRVRDKFQAAGLTPEPARRLQVVPLVAQCVGHIECRVKDLHTVGDHDVFIGEPVYACAQEDLFAEVWRVDRVKLVYHLGGRHFTTSFQEIGK